MNTVPQHSTRAKIIVVVEDFFVPAATTTRVLHLSSTALCSLLQLRAQNLTNIRVDARAPDTAGKILNGAGWCSIIMNQPSKPSPENSKIVKLIFCHLTRDDCHFTYGWLSVSSTDMTVVVVVCTACLSASKRRSIMTKIKSELAINRKLYQGGSDCGCPLLLLRLLLLHRGHTLLSPHSCVAVLLFYGVLSCCCVHNPTPTHNIIIYCDVVCTRGHVSTFHFRLSQNGNVHN